MKKQDFNQPASPSSWGGSLAARASRLRQGLTLVELLVVIGILVILAGFLIPGMRMISKDREIREASRVVASVFASAGQRAVNEGVAGIEIQRNQNIVDADGVRYAGTILYTLRKVPAYNGDSVGEVATITGPNTVTIVRPFEQDELTIIRINDYISFNYSSVRYRVLAVSAGDPMTLTLDMTGARPPLPTGVAAGVPFVVHRLPRRLESSRTELPEGYIIDLRLSGPMNFGGGPGLPAGFGTVPAGVPRPFFYELSTESVGYIFDQRGGLARCYVDSTNSVPIDRNQYFLIREYDSDDPSIDSILNNASNLWVTAGWLNGSANVAELTQTEGAGATLEAKLAIARQTATTGQSADQ